MIGFLVMGPLLGTLSWPAARAWWAWQSDPDDASLRSDYYSRLVDLAPLSMVFFESELASCVTELSTSQGQARDKAQDRADALIRKLSSLEDSHVRALVQQLLADQRPEAIELGLQVLETHTSLYPEHEARLAGLIEETREARGRRHLGELALLTAYKCKPAAELESLALEWLGSPDPELQTIGASLFKENHLTMMRHMDAIVAQFDRLSLTAMPRILEALGSFRPRAAIQRQFWKRIVRAPELVRPVALAFLLELLFNDLSEALDSCSLEVIRELALMPPIPLEKFYLAKSGPGPFFHWRLPLDWSIDELPMWDEAPGTTADVYGLVLGYRVAGLECSTPLGPDHPRIQDENRRKLLRFKRFRSLTLNEEAMFRFPMIKDNALFKEAIQSSKDRCLPDIRPLNQAATMEQFAAGKAIFHLDGKGTKAKLKLPATAETGPAAKPTLWLILQAERDKDGKLWLGGISRDDIRKLDADEVRGLRGG